MALELAQRSSIPATSSLAEAARASSATQGNFLFTSFLLHHFEQLQRSRAPFQEALAALGCKLLLAWNYDSQLMDRLGLSASVSGRDAIYVRPEETAIVYLSGTTTDPRNLVVLRQDYSRFREHEEDRIAILEFLERRLQGKLVLFIGHDPQDPDFSLLVRHILNGHLKKVPVQSILIAEAPTPALRWGRFPIRFMRADAFKVIEQLR
jgi:hypothetical protein